MKRRQWVRAIHTLREVAPSSDRAALLANLALAECHGQLGDSDRQLTVLRKAIITDPSSAQARLALASALRNAGRIDEALEQYREVVPLPQAPDGAGVLLGRLLVQRNRSLPAHKRRWAEVERVLERAARLPVLELPLTMLRADVHADRGHVDQAQTLLEHAAAAHPDEATLVTALAELALRQGQPERSAHLLADGRRRLSKRSELYQAEVTLGALREPRQGREMLRKLEKELDGLPADEQAKLLARMATTYFQLGEPADGRRLCRLLAGRAPEDLPSRLGLLDLALRGEDEALLVELVADVRRLEGEEGTWWRYGEASRLLLLAKRGDPRGRDEARTLVADIRSRRPDWPRGALVEAYLRELDGEQAAAADAYLRAFRGGERRAGMAERLVRLLAVQGRLDEADEAVRKHQLQTPPSPELARLGAEIALRQRNLDRARELAVLVAPADSNDYPKLIWLGQVLTLAGRQSEGEEVLRRAVRLRDDLAETWIALVAHLAKAGQVQEAEDVRDEMRQRLPADQVSLALAVCAEVLGELGNADQYYRQALTRTPEDGLVLQRAARFHLRLNHSTEAEPLLRHMLAPHAEVSAANQVWARRQLALLLAFGGEANDREVLALLEENKRRTENTILDRRARLLVQATHAGDRPTALRQLEETSKIQPFAPEELFRLVRLYEAENNLNAAHEKMIDLLGLDRNNPEYLAHHIDRLLRRGRKDEARPWIARLRKLEEKH